MLNRAISVWTPLLAVLNDYTINNFYSLHKKEAIGIRKTIPTMNRN